MELMFFDAESLECNCVFTSFHALVNIDHMFERCNTAARLVIPRSEYINSSVRAKAKANRVKDVRNFESRLVLTEV